jgi:hypothetical protein
MQVLFALGAEQVDLLRLEERHDPQSADRVARLLTDEAGPRVDVLGGLGEPCVARNPARS